MTALEFVVPGVPVPQGSKNPWGGEANPHVKSWRQTVAESARRNGNTLVDGPVAVSVSFVFPRPKKHFRTGKLAHELRPDAPRWHSSTPDLDKLQRAIGDAMKGVLLRDDSQIVFWKARKRYGSWARAEIRVTAL
jgi:Holliday junction resolvase RusA-like endonuclease